MEDAYARSAGEVKTSDIRLPENKNLCNILDLHFIVIYFLIPTKQCGIVDLSWSLLFLKLIYLYFF